jgi:hypothetical protein
MKTKAEWRRMRKVSNAKAKADAHKHVLPRARVKIPGHTDPRVPAPTATIDKLVKETGLSRDIVIGQRLRPGWDGHYRFPFPRLKDMTNKSDLKLNVTVTSA